MHHRYWNLPTHSSSPFSHLGLGSEAAGITDLQRNRDSSLNEYGDTELMAQSNNVQGQRSQARSRQHSVWLKHFVQDFSSDLVVSSSTAWLPRGEPEKLHPHPRSA